MARPTLRLGSTGVYVQELQDMLRQLGYYKGLVDQIFGNQTLAAVRSFQKDQYLVVDGIVGAKTWSALDRAINPTRPTLRLGSTGSYVRTLQSKLSALGYYTGAIDRIFGNKTLTAVRNFQRAYGLVADGVVGPLTWAALDSASTSVQPAIPVVEQESAIVETQAPEIQDVVSDASQASTVEPAPETQDLVSDASQESPVTLEMEQQEMTADFIAEEDVIEESPMVVIQDAASAEAAATTRPTLRFGSRGSYVGTLQQMLRTLGYYSGNIDQIFGNATLTAVRNFQRDHGLSVDGIVGPRTWTALDGATPTRPTLRLGSRGSYVGTLQQRLRTLGYYTGNIDQIFGNATLAAVRSFQRDHGLSVDGVVGPRTWTALDNATPTRPTLRFGSRGSYVGTLQQRLRTLGYYTGAIDQIFGNATLTAVRNFQRDHGLSVDGIVGPRTWTALDNATPTRPTLRFGSRGSYVGTLQQMLRTLGYYSGNIDQIFGSATQTAVRNFQRDHGLSVDGIVGPRTWTALDNAIGGFVAVADDADLPEDTASFIAEELVTDAAEDSAASAFDSEAVAATRPTLRLGSRGSYVGTLQQMLRTLGYYSGNIDQIFGNATLTAVRNFQRDHGLNVDGVVGPLTWAALDGVPPTRPTLRFGSRGSYVGTLQQRLRTLGYYSGNIDQIFGNATLTAVRNFQRDHGLNVDGVVGPLTWAALDGVPPTRPTLRLGSRGSYVGTLQQRLRTLGYYSGNIDQIFGSATLTAVRNFQRDHGLNVDGVVGPLTWTALDNATPTRPTLRLGSRGSYVGTLQQRLRTLGYYSGNIDQIFGSATQTAVRNFQRAYGLNVDGIVGPLTWAALDNAVGSAIVADAFETDLIEDVSTAIDTESPDVGVSDEPTEDESAVEVEAASRPTLRLGAVGIYVAIVQQMLHSLNFYSGLIDHIFASSTQTAVRNFQRAHGLVVDGVVGPITWNALIIASDDGRPVLRLNSRGQYVAILQQMLKTLGYYSGNIDQIFGTGTQTAVRNFQGAIGIAVDGIVGPLTWTALDIALLNPTRPTLRLGNTGHYVGVLQQMLRTLGYYTRAIDQIFGSGTQTAVRNFQRDQGLVVDGIVGPLTWAALDAAIENPTRPTLRLGNTGHYVGVLQQMLRTLGYYTRAIDQIFGSGTQTAVRNFQRDQGLVVDGIVGPLTWAALDNAINHPDTECPQARPVLQSGDTGLCVEELQDLLFQLGYFTGELTANFDNATLLAVIAFQQANNLEPDGIVGPLTWAAIDEAIGDLESSGARPVLRLGSTGSYVGTLQQMLITLGYYNGAIDRIFGANTQTAVRNFQLAYGLVADGVVGPLTWAALDAAIKNPTRPTLRLGSTGTYVGTLQQILTSLGYFTSAIDQIFGSRTYNAVRNFQRDHGLVVDGVVGPRTWAALDNAAGRPTLRHGDRGTYVTTLQQMLSVLGYYTGAIDAIFGNNTLAAVRNFQRNACLVVDGIVGPLTWAALDRAIGTPGDTDRPTLRLGDSGIHVQELLEILTVLSYYAGAINQAFTEDVQSAVITFQQDHSLTADGIVSSRVWSALFEALDDLAANQRPTIRLGDTGHYVQDLQMMLRLLRYYSGQITEIFDIPTQAAVRVFQTDSNLSVDGVVGPQTWTALDLAVDALSPVPPVTRPTLRLGDTGPFVQQLQEMLASLGFYSGPIDQSFGSLTEQAVRAFQRTHGLTADGIVGPRTWAALDLAVAESPPVNPNPTLREGSTGASVVSLHETLYLLGYYSGAITPVFDEATTASVKAFQSDSGLTPDGIVGPLTWTALNDALEAFNERYPTIQQGATGPAVRRLNAILSKLGFYNGLPSAVFSSQTRDAVLEFQASYGLVVDGIVGSRTWSRLEEASTLLNQPLFALIWSQNPSTFTITTDAFKVISPVWYQLSQRTNGTLFVNPRNASAAYSDAVHARGLQVWGTIQSFNADLTRRLVTNADTITQFVNEMNAFVVAHRLDGLVIDFEYMYVADKDRFTEFVRTVANRLRAEATTRGDKFVLAIAFTKPPGVFDQNNMWSASIDRHAVGKICDYSCMMLYDEHVAGNDPGPIASIGWVEEGIQQIIIEVPNNKALLGVPLYTGDWTSHRNSSGTFVLDGVIYYLTMTMVQNTITNGSYTDRSGTVITVQTYTVPPQTTQGVLHYEFIDTTGVLHNVWAETPETLSRKLDLMHTYSLPGAAAWEVSFGNAAAWDVVQRQMTA